MVPDYPRHMTRPPHLKGEAKQAGVLVLLYPLGGALTFVLTRRTETVATHKGQISLPGGAQEPGETLQQAAIRETCEELHLCLDKGGLDLLGALTPLYVGVSDFEVHPFVAHVPHRPAFQPDAIEVAEVLEMTLPVLLDGATKVRERWNLQGVDVDVPFYRVAGQAVWGATAIMLSEFEWRLRAVLDAL